MDFIICLAHFCETHGPASVLCTQIAPISCLACNNCSTPPHSDDLHRSPVSASTRTRTTTGQSISVNSSFGSPPASPCTLATDIESYFPKGSNSEPKSGPTNSMATMESDGYVYRRSVVPDAIDDEYCQNCSFLVPKDVSGQIPKGAPGSPSMDGKSRNGSPVLRSSHSITAYGSPSQHSSATSSASRRGNRFSSKTDTASFSSSSSSSASENNDLARSSPSSSLYMTLPTHTHRLTYISTRNPTAPVAYSNLRRSCIRTLSTENLPRGSGSGSLFFGDSIAGYSVAHVFRLPDPLARGRLRTYALIALGSRDNWKVSQVILEITRAFERLASHIVAMANRVLDNEAAAAAAVSDAKNNVGRSMSSTSAPTMPTTREAVEGSGAGKISPLTKPTVSAAKISTLREKGRNGNSSQDGVGEVTETLPAETKDDGDDDDDGYHCHHPAQQESPVIDATIPALTPKESQASETSTKHISPSITTATSGDSISLTPDTLNPKTQEQQEQQQTGNSSTFNLQSLEPEHPQQQQQQNPPKRPQPAPLRSMTPLSSFLAAKKVDPDGYPRDSHSASSMLEDAKKRGLAEIVGKEDFFVDLHATFVYILARLVGEFGVR